MYFDSERSFCDLLALTRKERKGPLFILSNRILLKANFQPGRAPHIIMVTGPPLYLARIWTQDLSV